MVDENLLMTLLRRHFIRRGAVSINSQGLISVDGDVTLKPDHVIPPEIKFLEVKGDFNCSNNSQLRSLKGSPQRVGRDFYCTHLQQLESLADAPKSVGRYFVCWQNPILHSLAGSPQTVGSFDCRANPKLESLLGAPQNIVRDFTCINLAALVSLEGAPKSVGRDFECSNNIKLESLEHSPQRVGRNFECWNNPLLPSLDGMPTEIGGKLMITYSENFPLLRALVAKKGIEFSHLSAHIPAEGEKVAEIINRYKGQGKMAIFDCQKDLEDAGFEGNARW
jgi:hypothetical protein